MSRTDTDPADHGAEPGGAAAAGSATGSAQGAVGARTGSARPSTAPDLPGGPRRSDGQGPHVDPDAVRTAAGDVRPRWRHRLLVPGLTAVVVLPLVVALSALSTPRWFPLLDLAQTEMRVRDVGTRHTPLVGLVGRLASDGVQGSHPGPLSFWALAPVYRLLGSTAWSLLLGVVLLNTAAVALTIWVARRRGGAVVALGFAAGLSVLLHLYGTRVLTEPWNPYMPVLWWTLTLVALWAVLCDDLAMLPVAVFAASFCMQTHISYVGLVGGLTALAAGAFVVRWVHVRHDRDARRRLAGWSALAVGLAVVLWLPTIIDQISGDPGNASIVIDHFRNPDDEPIGLARGAELFAVELNPWRLVAGDQAISGSRIPALVLLGAWAAAVALTVALPRARAGRSTVLRLHLVTGAALLLGFVSATRILGFLWFYLALWAWSMTLLVLIGIVWSCTLAVRARRLPAPEPEPVPAAPGLRHRPVAVAGIGALAAVLVGWSAWFALDARDAEPSHASHSELLGEFTAATRAAIDAGEVAGGGPGGRYLVTWTDGVHLGASGYGLVNELERAGYDAGVAAPFGPGARQHRVVDPDEATAEVHISFGPDIPVWDARPDVERILYVDRRTPEQLRDYERARTEAIEGLQRAGLDDMAPLVDTAPFQLYFDEHVPDDVRHDVQVITLISQPAAVFVGPPPPPPPATVG